MYTPSNPGVTLYSHLHYGKVFKMKNIYLLSLVSLIFTTASFAQTTSTSILGTVTDASGASISGAKVTATNVKTSVASTTVTTETGDYAFPILDIGEYQVVVEQPGFKGETRKGIVLQVNEKFRVDFRLQVGSQAEPITVTAEAANLRTDEASIGGTVEQRRLVELPMNGRNVGNFAVLIQVSDSAPATATTDNPAAAAACRFPDKRSPSSPTVSGKPASMPRSMALSRRKLA